MHDTSPQTRVAPTYEARLTGCRSTIMRRNLGPRSPRTQPPQNAVEHAPIIHPLDAPRLGEQRLNRLPFAIVQVGRTPAKAFTVRSHPALPYATYKPAAATVKRRHRQSADLLAPPSIPTPDPTCSRCRSILGGQLAPKRIVNHSIRPFVEAVRREAGQSQSLRPCCFPPALRYPSRRWLRGK